MDVYLVLQSLLLFCPAFQRLRFIFDITVVFFVTKSSSDVLSIYNKSSAVFTPAVVVILNLYWSVASIMMCSSAWLKSVSFVCGRGKAGNGNTGGGAGAWTGGGTAIIFEYFL